MKIEVLTGGGVCGSFATHTPPLDSRFRGNDELGGDSTGTTHFRTNRSSRLAPAYQGMKIEVPTGGSDLV